MVPEAGIEPARISPGDFESPASTNFTTRAGTSEERNYGTVRGMKFHTLKVSIANKPPAGSNGCLLHAQPNHFLVFVVKISLSVLAKASLQILAIQERLSMKPAAVGVLKISLLTVVLLCSGCAVVAVVDTVVVAGATVVKTAVKATGAVIDTVIPEPKK